MSFQQIGIVGAGTMGGGIAQVAARAGLHVLLYDSANGAAQRAVDAIAARLDGEVEKRRLSEENREAALSRIEVAHDLTSVKDSPLILEAASEDLVVKKEIFRSLDRVCRVDTVLATNTSSLSVTDLAAATRNPQRVVGMHFFNPVPRMALVEVIPGLATDEKVVADTFTLAQQLGKTPIRVQDRPGFVVNRLLIPMINEAAFVLAEGVASAEDIDRAMQLGAGHPMGPLALADLIGLDVCLAIMETFARETGDQKYRPASLLRQYVRAGRLGRKTGRGFFEYARDG